MSEPVRTALLYCMACALHEENASADVLSDLCGGNLSELFQMAKRHSVAALTAAALSDTLSGEAAEPWRQASLLAVRRAVLMDAERREILAFLEASGIWYMPLKGAILQYFYPRYGQREMSDNDILHDPDALRTIHKWMLARGYRLLNELHEIKSDYARGNAYHFEMHTELFNQMDTPFYEYYRGVEERLLPDPETEYGRHFSDEDFYLYMLAHAFRHFRDGGTGLRTLLDVYVWREKKGAGMDWDYVKRELAKLGMTEFERRVSELSRELLSNPAETVSRARTLSDANRAFLDYLESSGTYGTLEQKIQNEIKRAKLDSARIKPSVKWKYCLYRLRHWAGNRSRENARCPVVLYPFYLAGCLLRDIVRKREFILRDLRAASRLNESVKSNPLQDSEL